MASSMWCRGMWGSCQSRASRVPAPVGQGRLRFLFQAGVLSVGSCLHLCQDTAFQKPLFLPVAFTHLWLNDHIVTAVIPAQFACKEFTVPLVRTDMLVSPR